MSKTYVPLPLRRQVTEDARHRCGYCLTSQRIIGRPMAVEHIVPESKGGATVRDNLENGTQIIGLTAIGRATVVALRLNNEEIVGARWLWAQAGWHPPDD